MDTCKIGYIYIYLYSFKEECNLVKLFEVEIFHILMTVRKQINVVNKIRNIPSYHTLSNIKSYPINWPDMDFIYIQWYTPVQPLWESHHAYMYIYMYTCMHIHISVTLTLIVFHTRINKQVMSSDNNLWIVSCNSLFGIEINTMIFFRPHIAIIAITFPNSLSYHTIISFYHFTE